MAITINVTVVVTMSGERHRDFHIQRDQHYIKSLRNWLIIGNDKPVNSPLYIYKHLLNSSECAKQYEDKKFSIFSTERDAFHLSVLEYMYIKTLKQKL